MIAALLALGWTLLVTPLRPGDTPAADAEGAAVEGAAAPDGSEASPGEDGTAPVAGVHASAVPVGQLVALTVRDEGNAAVAGAAVHAVLRPGLPGEHRVSLGRTSRSGRITWTPEEAGPYRLTATGSPTQPTAHAVVVVGAPARPGIAELLSGLGLAALGLVGVFLHVRARSSHAGAARAGSRRATEA